ncbi:hypothetical protein Dimus_020176, partial [Dionaea muscipula]
VVDEQSIYICNACADCNYGDSAIPVEDKSRSQVGDGVKESSHADIDDREKRNRLISPSEAKKIVKFKKKAKGYGGFDNCSARIDKHGGGCIESGEFGFGNETIY